MADTLVYLTDRDHKPVTDPIEWTFIDAMARYLEPGTASVECPARGALVDELAIPGRRAVLMHGGKVFLAGPIERPRGPYQWVAGPGADATPGRLTFHFTDDLSLVVARRTYPDPSQPWSNQTARTHYEDTGPASSVILGLANVNAGPGAIPTRRVPRLVMGADPLAGATVTISTRFQPLGDELRALVTAAGNAVGFRTSVNLADREATFEVFETVDRSASVRFSRALGNLRAVTMEDEIPRTTAALVAGEGEGTARITVERVDSTAEAQYWRYEDLRDRRDSSDAAVLNQAGDEMLAQGSASARLATITIDTPDQRYGEHYGLGDRVSVEPVPGIMTTDIVRAAHLQVSARTGAVLTAIVGSQAFIRDPEWLRQYRELAGRLARLEAI